MTINLVQALRQTERSGRVPTTAAKSSSAYSTNGFDRKTPASAAADARGAPSQLLPAECCTSADVAVEFGFLGHGERGWVEEARVRVDATVRPHLERQKLVDRDGEVRGGKCDGLIVLDQMGGGKRDRAEAPNAQVTIAPEPIWSALPIYRIYARAVVIGPTAGPNRGAGPADRHAEGCSHDVDRLTSPSRRHSLQRVTAATYPCRVSNQRPEPSPVLRTLMAPRMTRLHLTSRLTTHFPGHDALLPWFD